MADIELVIKMPEGLKNDFESEQWTALSCMEMKNALEKATPIDLEGLKSDMKALNCGFPYGLDYLLDCLDKRLGITIIEVDKEQTDGNNN